MIKKVIVTSGPTVEPIDPVRFISNRSSGKSGYYLALEAQKRGILEIVYITGPSRYIPDGVEVLQVETALQMQKQLQKHGPDAQVILMAAAVADYRPVDYRDRKIKKSEDTLTLRLIKNPDLLAELGRNKKDGQVLVGYAAETNDIMANARRKLEAKNIDLLVLNQISDENPAFDVDHNRVYLVTRGETRPLPSMPKSEIAVHIWDAVMAIRQDRRLP